MKRRRDEKTQRRNFRHLLRWAAYGAALCLCAVAVVRVAVGQEDGGVVVTAGTVTLGEKAGGDGPAEPIVIPVGETVLTEPLTLRAGQQLVGAGVNSVLTFDFRGRASQPDACLRIVGVNNCVVRDVTIKVKGRWPKCGILLARSEPASAGWHTLLRVNMPDSYYTVGCAVDICSERALFDDCAFRSAGIGASCIVFAAHNLWQFEGVYGPTTLAEGGYSAVANEVRNCDLRTACRDGDEVCIRIIPPAAHIVIADCALTGLSGSGKVRQMGRAGILIGSDERPELTSQRVVVRGCYGELREMRAAVEVCGAVGTLLLDGNRLPVGDDGVGLRIIGKVARPHIVANDWAYGE